MHSYQPDFHTHFAALVVARPGLRAAAARLLQHDGACDTCAEPLLGGTVCIACGARKLQEQELTIEGPRYVATWEGRDGRRLRSRVALTLEDIEAYTAPSERVVELQAEVA